MKMKLFKLLKSLLCRHRYIPYIYYDRYNYIFICEKCDMMVFYDLHEKIKTKDQKLINEVRNTVISALGIKNDDCLIKKTHQMTQTLKDKDHLNAFIKALKETDNI